MSPRFNVDVNLHAWIVKVAISIRLSLSSVILTLCTISAAFMLRCVFSKAYPTHGILLIVCTPTSLLQP